MAEPEYTLIRSDRRTISLQITPGGLVVRAPRRMPMKEIQRFLTAHGEWIRKHTPTAPPPPKFSEEELETLKELAKPVLARRVAYYAPLVGVKAEKITVRLQKSRWGSCSGQGNLNFNALLLLAPPEVLDSVVVHELCHRKQMNHSPAFYREVYRVFPEYEKHHAWLKENGPALLARLP